MAFTPGDGPQHVRALERANHVRSARATAKRRIASGELTAAEVILAHQWEFDTMPITEILITSGNGAGDAATSFSSASPYARTRRSVR
jgi:hypothetical protein